MSEIQNLFKNINIGDSVLVEINKRVVESGFVYFMGNLPLKKIERDGHFYEYYQEALIITKDRMNLTIITLGNDEKKILKSSNGNFKHHNEYYNIKDNDVFFIKPSSIFLNEICFL